MKGYKRRSVLAITGATVGSVSGCAGLPFSPFSSDRYIPGGSVVFDNNTGQSHSLTVKIRLVAATGDAIPENLHHTPEHPPSEDVREPITHTYDAEPQGEVVDESVATEPGSYYMSGALSDGRYVGGWYEYDEHLYVEFDLDSRHGFNLYGKENYD